jgi:nuclear pore complex protein Nup155
MKGARILEFDKLREVIGDYQQLNYAKGAVDLPLHCAAASDPDHLGQEYWLEVPDPSGPSSLPPQNTTPAASNPDTRKEFWERRVRCYDLVLDSLEEFEGQTVKGDEDAERVRAHGYELAFGSVDEMFHSRLYEWLIFRGLADELLEVSHSCVIMSSF